jgi:phage baseplate assembly protein W
MDEGKLYGRGMAFPPVVGADGRIAWSTGGENVRENIRVILLTQSRERLMLPQFGSGLKRFLFQPNTVATHRLIQEAIVQSLGRWEPRIRVDSVTVEPDPDDPRAALASVRYTLIATQAADQVRLRVSLSN